MLPNRKSSHQNPIRIQKFSSSFNSKQLGVPSSSFPSHFLNAQDHKLKQIKTRMLKSQQLGNMVLQFSHKEINSRLKAQHKKYGRTAIKRLRQVENLCQDKRKVIDTSQKNKIVKIIEEERKVTSGRDESPSSSHSFIKIIDCLETVRKNQLLNYQKSQNSDSKPNLFSSGDTYVFNLISRRSQRQGQLVEKQTRILANHSINNTKRVWEKQKGQQFESKGHMTMTKTREKSRQVKPTGSMENYNSINIMTNNFEKRAQTKEKNDQDKNNIEIVESISIQYHDQQRESQDMTPFYSQQCYSPVHNEKMNGRILLNRSCEEKHNLIEMQNVLEYFSTNKILSSAQSQSFQSQIGFHSDGVNKFSFSKEKSSFPQNLLTLSNQLDLGVKIIDDSFQISAIDEQAGSHELWINISIENNKGSNRLEEGKIYKKDMQDIILDESEVIAENEELKQKLNLLLERGSKIESSEQKLEQNRGSLLPLEWIQTQKGEKERKKERIEQIQVPDKKQKSGQKQDSRHHKQIFIGQNIKMQKSIFSEKKTGLIYQRCSYQIDQDLQSTYQLLIDRNIKIGFHKNIISVYHSTSSNQRFTVFKQLFFQEFPMESQSYSPNLQFYRGFALDSLLKSNFYFQINKIQARTLIKQLLSVYVIASKFDLQMSLFNIYICPLSPTAKQFSIKVDFAKLQYYSTKVEDIEQENLAVIYKTAKYLKITVQKIYPQTLSEQTLFLSQMNAFISFLQQQITNKRECEGQKTSNKQIELDGNVPWILKGQSKGKINDIQISQILTHPFIYENGTQDLYISRRS